MKFPALTDLRWLGYGALLCPVAFLVALCVLLLWPLACAVGFGRSVYWGLRGE